ncbi:MAG: hypothetical protein JO336_07815 [Acidobacteriia bacterium]|nr:hypothetical protein [Terriglobia bacterium]
MRPRFPRLIRIALPAAVLALVAFAEDIPRLTNGKPDFNGVWDHPRVADVTRNSNACGATATGCSQQGSGELPFTEWGLAQWKDVQHRFDYSAHCLPWGYTRAWQVEYPVEIMQTPERLALLFESNNIFHVIFTDGRDHPKNLEPSWMGDSVGKWDGDTLVIDTIGFNGRTWIDTAEHPSSDQLHVTERVHFIDRQHLGYEVTWEDPKTYTRPIKNTRILARMKPGEELMEYWCMENNKDLLEGHLSR